jgi:tRNA(His) guanylyltransferase
MSVPSQIKSRGGIKMNDTLGDRMKGCYEDRYRFYLTRRTPVILRLDGVAFHTFTRKLHKPFDECFSNAMTAVAEMLMKEVKGAQLVYTQSDEISVLLVDYKKFESDAWYDYNLQKLSSVPASMAASVFQPYAHSVSQANAFFDCRAFNIPKEDVENYFVWRQKDWQRNSVQMLARSIWSQKQLHGKSVVEMKKMLSDNGTPWDKLDARWRNGVFVCEGGTDHNFVFSDALNRSLIDQLLEPEEK